MIIPYTDVEVWEKPPFALDQIDVFCGSKSSSKFFVKLTSNYSQTILGNAIGALVHSQHSKFNNIARDWYDNNITSSPTSFDKVATLFNVKRDPKDNHFSFRVSDMVVPLGQRVNDIIDNEMGSEFVFIVSIWWDAKQDKLHAHFFKGAKSLYPVQFADQGRIERRI